VSDWNAQIIEEFRRSGGQVGGPFAGATLLLLTTAGARTGRPHTTPVVYRRDGDRLLIFGSNAGGPRHPAWYHNLRANPWVTVEGGAARLHMTAHPLEGDERDREYAHQAAADPAFAAYQAGTERLIPVIALTPDDRARALGDELVRIHADLRARLDALLTGADRPAPPDAQLLENCLTLCQDLHHHHVNENDRGFPLLERRFPGIGPVLDRLRNEHEIVGRLREQIEQTRDLTRLKQLAAELTAHFDHEERQLVAALNTL
jgi:deazaflavin-dependent oxidoreductase (nitroreductase family)